jgi:hypothetical protein
VWGWEFFDPLFAGRRRTEARRADVPREQWIRATEQEVRQRLSDLINNLLMKDEGLDSLAPEVKEQGLAAFMAMWREEQKSHNLGSQVLADRAAQTKQRQYFENLDEQARDYEEKILIDIIRQKLNDSIVINSEDIRRFYKAHPETFNPPAVVAFSMIVVPSGRADDAAAVRWALEEGAPFADVASLPLNSYKPAKAGRLDEKRFDGDYDKAELFGPAPLASAARSLTPGAWTGPFDNGGDLTFLRLDSVVKNSVSLYDAQSAIENFLHRAEFEQRMLKKIAGLKSRSSLTDQEEMVRRLMRYAEAKFLPPAG